MIYAPAIRRDSHSPAAGLLQLVGLLGAPIQDPQSSKQHAGGMIRYCILYILYILYY